MIRNIVFDMGNVLITFDPALFMTREGITDPEDRRIIMNELFLSLEWAQMDSGVLQEETAAPTILKRLPEHLRDAAERLLFHWADGRESIPGMESLVRRLKERGYGLYLLSNASRAQHAYWPLYPVSRYFDGKMISCDVHCVKPDPAIYRLFTDRFSLQPEECVFVDDSTANVAAAVHSGWQGIVFHGSASELEERMREKGILF